MTTENSTKKIVILEDERSLLKALNIKLSKDFKIYSATNGKAGFALIQEQKPNLILLDLNMPIMSGFEVLEKMKEDAKLKKIPVLVLSNLEEEQDKERCRKLGVKGYYVKSNIKIEDIAEKIKKII